MNVLTYLEMVHGWQPTMETSRSAMGCCPYHSDHTPSFKISFTEVPYFFHCFGMGCPLSGTGLYGIVRHLEFGGRDDPESRRQIAARVKALGGDEQVPDTWSHSHTRAEKRERREIDLRPLPTEEQQVCITAAHSWWRKQLFGNSAKDIRAYVRSRGLHLDYVEAIGRVGYAPDCHVGSQNYRDLSRVLAEVCGDDWLTVATSIGVFARDTDAHARMHDRLIFSQVDEDTGLVQMFLGRAMKEHPTHKWLLPYTIRKVPFSVPVAKPVLEGTTIVEGPIEALILAQPCTGYTGVAQVAQIGRSTIPMSYLKGLAHPLFVAFNNDAPQPVKRYDGTLSELRCPGEDMAQDLIRRLRTEGIPYYRVMVPTTEDKDIDNFVKKHGIWRWIERYPQNVAIAI